MPGNEPGRNFAHLDSLPLPASVTTSAPPNRVPLPLHDVLARLEMTPAAGVQAALAGVVVQPFVLQDFRPITQTLEWELSSLYWADVGVLPFADNDVPFVINNTGRLSQNAAALRAHGKVGLLVDPHGILVRGEGDHAAIRYATIEDAIEAARQLC